MENKKKFLIVLTKELIERIDDYKFENRFESRSEVIRFLLDWGLKQNPKKGKG